MTGGHRPPRVLTLPTGVPFLPTLVETLLDGRLVPGFRYGGDPLALAAVTVYVPTRRAARELRGVFVDHMGGQAAILPVIRPLGEFDEDEALFDAADDLEALDPPIADLDRLLLLAPMVRAWKRRLPAEVAQRFAEELVVPASAADALWLARDLGGLIDEVETLGADWASLKGLVSDDYAGWWQVTLEFLRIVTEFWPAILRERGVSDPAAHRSALLKAEALRLSADPPDGPVVAAGSTGSIPATADLLATIARLPQGAVVLPGLDLAMDDASWSLIEADDAEPAICGHPQYGLARLLRRLKLGRGDVESLVRPPDPMRLRAALMAEAFRPAGTTEAWAKLRGAVTDEAADRAFADVALAEAASEREEALVIATALRHAVEEPGATAALVTTDRDLARRVSAELLRFGIVADDSAGKPLASTPPAALLRLMLRAFYEPGDPVPIIALLKHPLLRLGLPRRQMLRTAGIVELIALRGGSGRPALDELERIFADRYAALAADPRLPPWFARLSDGEPAAVAAVLGKLREALAPLRAAAADAEVDLAAMARATVLSLEALARDEDGSVAALYEGDAGARLADFLRRLAGASSAYAFAPAEWPDVMDALMAPEAVKPSQGSDPRVSIWGALEARLLSPDTLVIGGLNEGIWPRKAVADRFLSRFMKAAIALEPPERRIGQAAHDFQMAMGARRVVLTRAARAGDSPAVPSRWLQRLLAFLGKDRADRLRARGVELRSWAHTLDRPQHTPPASRPEPRPSVALRPTQLSVTEVETLRRDPYAIYARRILRLEPLEPLVRDPSAAERGTLFHAILHRFATTVAEPGQPEALARLLAIGAEAFRDAELPADVSAVWWPRFERLAANLVAWEGSRSGSVQARHSEARAQPLPVGVSPLSLFGFADRIDLQPSGLADIVDFKTGAGPSKRQAHQLVSPQLALEAALLRRGAFTAVGAREPADLLYVRLKADGEVVPESILELRGSAASLRSAGELAEDAWARLERLGLHYADPANGYLSRALPFRDDMQGPYDHLARVPEWSAGDDGEGGDA